VLKAVLGRGVGGGGRRKKKEGGGKKMIASYFPFIGY
jgi:hypothetical protein